jgi:tRNA(Arg) A34 adenosine deaminase TadA
MDLVIRLSRMNIDHRTGGPFGAAVFDSLKGTLIAPGVNLVTSTNWSGAHAEQIALALAQKTMQTYRLGAVDCHLVTSSEPCSMCLGAVRWSGVRRLIIGARTHDVESIGFTEGKKIKDWAGELEQHGVEITRDLMRNEAAGVLQYYKANGGTIYNG